MKTRELGGSGIETSAIGLGCMGMSEFYGPSDDAENMATLERALEIGVTFLDTADMYGHGSNEELLGRFLKGRRERVVLATKFGIVRSDDPDARPIDTSPAYVKAACEASLRRLGTETIDLYYMHRRNADVPIEDTVGAMAELVAEGKVRALGLCEVAPDTIRRAHATHPIAVVQSEYSLWARDMEEDVLPTTRKLGIGFVPYSPLGRGALTGAMPSTAELSKNDFRRSLPRYREEVYARNVETIAVVERIAKAHRATTAQIALAWLLAQDESIVPIPGTRKVHRVKENAGASEIELTPDDLSELDRSFGPNAIEGSRLSPAGAALVDL